MRIVEALLPYLVLALLVALAVNLYLAAGR
jgi:hypothetical protein